MEFLKTPRWGLFLAVAICCLVVAACQEATSPPSLSEAAVASGGDLYQRLACRGCHTLQGRGGHRGPALDGIGQRLTREELERQLLTPRRGQAGPGMPSFAFVRPEERKDLLDFLQYGKK